MGKLTADFNEAEAHMIVRALKRYELDHGESDESRKLIKMFRDFREAAGERSANAMLAAARGVA